MITALECVIFKCQGKGEDTSHITLCQPSYFFIFFNQNSSSLNALMDSII